MRTLKDWSEKTTQESKLNSCKEGSLQNKGDKTKKFEYSPKVKVSISSKQVSRPKLVFSYYYHTFFYCASFVRTTTIEPKI